MKDMPLQLEATTPIPVLTGSTVTAPLPVACAVAGIDKARKIEGDLKFPLSCHELPSHISLKISFFVEDDKFDKVVEELTNLYHHLLPFTVECDGIQKEGQIVWLRIKENVLLKCAQISVNSLLERHFNVPLHPYDCDFKFHSTLFMDNDKERIDSAYELIKDLTFPKTLSVNKFIII